MTRKVQLYGRCPDNLRFFRSRENFLGKCPENSHRVGGIKRGQSLQDGVHQGGEVLRRFAVFGRRFSGYGTGSSVIQTLKSVEGNA